MKILVNMFSVGIGSCFGKILNGEAQLYRTSHVLTLLMC